MNKTATGERRARRKPITGPSVAKALLETLRELRERDIHQNPGTDVFFRDTEEIEAWEDLIRAQVRDWRSAPREILRLDEETTVALDRTCFPLHGKPLNDGAREYRRTFALRAIKAVCQAWIDTPDERRPWISELAVNLRPLTEAEKSAELLAMRAAIDMKATT